MSQTLVAMRAELRELKVLREAAEIQSQILDRKVHRLYAKIARASRRPQPGDNMQPLEAN